LAGFEFDTLIFKKMDWFQHISSHIWREILCSTHLHMGFESDFFHSGFQTKYSVLLPFLSLRATFIAILIILRHEYKLRSSSLYSSPPVSHYSCWHFVLNIVDVWMSVLCTHIFFFSLALQPDGGQGLLVVEFSRSHTMTHIGRTPLDEWSARDTDLYMLAQDTHKRQITMPPAEFLFSILLYSFCTSSVLFSCLDCPAFCLFVFTYNT
jgi:hypothetical protein